MSGITTRPARPFTYHDLAEMPDDGYRREVIGGVLIVTPAPNLAHQRAVTRLAALLWQAETSDHLVVVAPFDWHLPDGGSVEPDLLVIRRIDADWKGSLGPDAVPALVVEVLSPSNAAQDRSVKRSLYEHFGVPAYWIVDVNQPSILALRLTEGRYQNEAEVNGTDRFSTDWPFAVTFSPADLTS